MGKRKIFSALAVILGTICANGADACTGITLKSKDNGVVTARTIEWGESEMENLYTIVPRGYIQQSMLPGGDTGGMTFSSMYGYVGLAVVQPGWVMDGMNEAGLSAGLFYFPGYGKYEDYVPGQAASSISDLQFVSWILGNFATVEEVKTAVKDVHIVSVDSRASTVHWRIADKSGTQVVLEIIDGELYFYENKLGVLANSPGFEWQMTNLNNYVNLFPGTVQPHSLGGVEIASFGAGSGFLGIPGDITPPSRFVRAAFYQVTAPRQPDAMKTVYQGFQILNSFDIPIGIEFKKGEVPADIPSATQWTSVTDLTNGVIFYRTMYNSTIRSIDLKAIDFEKSEYTVSPLDNSKQQPVEQIRVL